MNNYGYILKEYLGFIIGILIALFITMIMYNRTFGELFDSTISSNSYKDIEKDLIEVAYNYVNNYYYKPIENGDSDYVTIKKLKEKEIITRVVDLKNKNLECSGYIFFHKDNGKTTFEPYIKCGDNYQTEGYDKYYDENVK